MKVSIIGAGFSGLALSYYLVKKGFAVDVYDKKSKVGGLIETVVSPWGQYEKAAGSFLNSAQIEEMSRTIGVPLISLPPYGKRKYIYWGNRPQSFPFGIHDTFALLRLISLFLFKPKKYRPLHQEEIGQWAKRVLGSHMQKIVCTALQGIYGGQTEKLSASLLFGPRLQKNQKKPQKTTKLELGRGSVYPQTGMEGWMKALQAWLEQNHVRFFLGKSCHKDQVSKIDNYVVVCIPAYYLEQCGWAKLFGPFCNIQYSSIIAIHTFRRWDLAQKQAPRIRGFGCLFPVQSGFHSLGVIFPEGQFQSNHAPYLQERWLIGQQSLEKMNNEEFFAKIESDFYKLHSQRPHFLHKEVIRHPHALPRYNLYLENILREKPVQTGRYYLFGNYIGSIGLTKLAERAQELAQKIFITSQNEIY